MNFINQILNLAALLLWLNWRAPKLTRRTSNLSLVSTVRGRAGLRVVRWLFLVALGVLLVVRGWFYGEVADGIGWTAALDLGPVAPHFRTDDPGPAILFSFLSFGLVLGGFYAWLLLVSVVNRSVPDSDRWQRQVRLQLGWVEWAPAALKLVLPFWVAGLLWYFGAPGVLNLTLTPAQRWQESAVIGLASFLIWKYLVIGILLLHMVNSYVYLGNSDFWNFVHTTARGLLRPLRPLPLCVGRIDFAPFLGVVLWAVGCEYAAAGLAWLYPRLPL